MIFHICCKEHASLALGQKVVSCSRLALTGDHDRVTPTCDDVTPQGFHHHDDPQGFHHQKKIAHGRDQWPHSQPSRKGPTLGRHRAMRRTPRSLTVRLNFAFLALVCMGKVGRAHRWAAVRPELPLQRRQVRVEESALPGRPGRYAFVSAVNSDCGRLCASTKGLCRLREIQTETIQAWQADDGNMEKWNRTSGNLKADLVQGSLSS